MTLSTANAVLARWNSLDDAAAASDVLPCCGSHAWAAGLAARRPIGSIEELLTASDEVWRSLAERDWQEAFDSHPRIGQQHAKAAIAESLKFSGEEQRSAMSSDEAVKAALADGNRRYEAQFGRIFIVCAAGKSASEIMGILEMRLRNSADMEIKEAAEQQRQITQLRLRRWLEAA